MLTTYVLETRQKDFYCSFIVVLKSKSAETGSSLGLSCWPCHLNVSISGLCEVAFVIITSLPLVQPSKHAWFVSPYTFFKRVFKISNNDMSKLSFWFLWNSMYWPGHYTIGKINLPVLSEGPTMQLQHCLEITSKISLAFLVLQLLDLYLPGPIIDPDLKSVDCTHKFHSLREIVSRRYYATAS